MFKLLSILSYLVMSSMANRSGINCRTHATILRQIKREGFHLDINSLIEIVIDVEVAWRWENCSVILKENISNSFYVNRDELSDLARSGVSRACTYDEVNIEKPQYLSKEHIIYVYGQLQRSQNLVFVHLSFPLHMRYHKPKIDGGYSLGKLKPPILLVTCPNVTCRNLLSIKAPCNLCGSEFCTWIKFPYKTNNHNMTLSVPVGNLSHLWFVKPLTYILTYGGCFYIAFTLFITSNKSESL